MPGEFEGRIGAARPTSCRRKRAGLVALLAAIALTGSACRTPPSLDGNWGIPPYEARGDAVSLDLVIVADNQLHHLYGEPVWLRSGFTNQIVPVAIRPVQLDFYAAAILQWIVEYTGNRPIVHLGDALNAACIWEWEAFLPIMNRAAAGWVMAPGNHDGYYFGNGDFAQEEWLRVCDTGDGRDGRMTKDRLVEHYLRALAAQGILELPDTLDGDGIQRLAGARGPSGQLHVEEVAWRIDRARPWRSFVVQRLNISRPNSPQRAVVVLLDTSQFDRRPRLVPWWFTIENAGVSGEFLADQIGVVDGWLREGEVNVLMGHHPYGVLTSRGANAIDRWRRDGGMALYVSAHTHKAQWFVREGSEKNWLELNVGSTTDWSPEFRTLLVAQSEAPGKVGIRTQRTPVADKWDDECEKEWEADPDSEFYYIRYNAFSDPDPVKTQVLLMNTLLDTHRWVLRNIRSSPGNTAWPPGARSDDEVLGKIERTMNLEGNAAGLGAKVALARQLRDFEANRSVESPYEQKQFHLCQAMWASKYNLDGARAPGVNDAYLDVPKE